MYTPFVNLLNVVDFVSDMSVVISHAGALVMDCVVLEGVSCYFVYVLYVCSLYYACVVVL